VCEERGLQESEKTQGVDVVKDEGFWETVKVSPRCKVTFYTRKKPEGGESMGCKTHRGPRGGRFVMKRKKGGGTRRVYKK